MAAAPVIAVDRHRQRTSDQLIRAQYIPLYGRLFGDDQFEKLHGPADILAMQARIPQHFRDPSVAPLRKLSVDLITTYKHINDVYYARLRNLRAQEAKGENKSHQDERKISNDGHNNGNHENVIKNGEKSLNRDETDNVKEKGSLGQVVKASDQEEPCQVEIKIVKKKKKLFKIIQC